MVNNYTEEFWENLREQALVEEDIEQRSKKLLTIDTAQMLAESSLREVKLTWHFVKHLTK